MITTAYESLTDFQALYQTYEHCRKKKHPTYGQIRFERNLSHELVKLQTALRDHSYQMSSGRRFLIKEPKPRWITVLPFPDKIVQKLLCETAFQPYLETHSIYDSAACQKGKGVTFAILRLKKHLRNYYKEHGNKGYVLKADIKNFYPSIDVQQVKNTWLPIIEDEQLCRLIEQILQTQTRGMAMGNQLSTIFAVYYLNPLDRYIKEQYRMKYYSRYVDDFIVIGESKLELQNLLTEIKDILNGLHLELNMRKTAIMPLKQGVEYVGWHFYVSETGRITQRLRKASKEKTKRKLKEMNWKLSKGMLSYAAHSKQYRGMIAHMKQGDTYQLRRNLAEKVRRRVGSEDR